MEIKTTIKYFNLIEKTSYLLINDVDNYSLIQNNLKKIFDLSEKINGKIVSYFTKDIEKKILKTFDQSNFAKCDFINIADFFELLIGGKDSYDEIYRCIDNAKYSIEIEMFIWNFDKSGKKLIDKLIKASERGVKVNAKKDLVAEVFEKGLILNEFNLDEYGNFENNKNIDFQQKMFWNHSKNFIIDNEIAIFGGINVGDFLYENHDMMIKVKGNHLINLLRYRFLGYENYYYNLPFEFYLNKFVKNNKILAIKPKVMDLLDNAQKEIIIEIPYISDIDIINKLKLAIKRGIKIKMILPKNSDWQDSLNKKTAKNIKNIDKSKSKVEIYYYKKKLHSKVMLIDNKYCFFGSANFNTKSTETFQETNILIKQSDNKFMKDLFVQLNKDMKSIKSDLIIKTDDIKYNEFYAFLESLLT